MTTPDCYLGDLRETLGIRLHNPQATILRQINDHGLTRDDVAATYAWALRQATEVDFAVVNAAIVDRWSVAALGYVKARAWRRLEGKA